MFRFNTLLTLPLMLLACSEAPTEVTPDNTDSPFLWFGKTKAEAIAKADADGTLFRVAREDEQRFPMTRDLREGRVTFEIDAGKITSAVTEGSRGGRREGAADPKLIPYIGLGEAEATAMAKTNGAPCRVADRDGEPQALTMDHRPDRVNFAIQAGIVIAAFPG